MISRTIKYVDYNGVEKEETFWFNMSQRDLIKLESSIEGGWENRLRQLVMEQNGYKAYEFFENFVNDAYGVKTVDGGFDKDPAHLKAFQTKKAYSDLIWSFVEHPDQAAEFINGIVASVDKKVDVIDIDQAVKQNGIAAGSKVMNFVTPSNP